MRRVVHSRVVLVLALVLAGAVSAAAQAPVVYKVTVPEPEHHWLQVEATFTDLGRAPLDLQMSRSSPGATRCTSSRRTSSRSRHSTAPAGRWRCAPGAVGVGVSGHGGTVRVRLPAVRRWRRRDVPGGRHDARAPEHARHVHVGRRSGGPADPGQFVPPAGFGWRGGERSCSRRRPLVFTAPNLQYFMDSPTELAPLVTATFTCQRDQRPRALPRDGAHDGTQAESTARAAESGGSFARSSTVFGEFPDYEPGTYTFILDHVPWAHDDGMEHRNSTS